MFNDLLLFSFGVSYSLWKIFTMILPATDIAASIFGGIIGSIMAYGLVTYKEKKKSESLQFFQ